MYVTRAVMQKYRAPADDKTGDGGATPPADGATPPTGDTPPADGGTPPDSKGTPPADDKGTPPADKGTPPADKGTPPADKGTPPADDKTGDPWGGLREKIAGGDEKKLARLNRYASPQAAIDALFALQTRISAGELRSVLPKNATPEQIATWRAENGIPESPDKYELKLRDGLVIGEADKPIIDEALKVLHGTNATSAQASALVDWYYNETVRQADVRAQKDKEFAQANEDLLRSEWKDEFRPNMNMVTGLISTMPAEAQQLFMAGRLANGDPIMSHPAVLKTLVTWAREINPVGTVVHNAGANVASAIEDEISTIEKKMQAPKGSPEYKDYWESDKTQARYRELLEARDRVAKK